MATCPWCGKAGFEVFDCDYSYNETCISCGKEKYFFKEKEQERYQCDKCKSQNGIVDDTPEYFAIRCANCDIQKVLLRKRPVVALFTEEQTEIINGYKKIDQLAKEMDASMSQVKCPKCGSTQISTDARGFSVVWGLVGAGKTVNRCASCGYKWTPKR